MNKRILVGLMIGMLGAGCSASQLSYKEVLENRLKNINQQIQSFKPVTQKMVKDAKAVLNQKKKNIAAQIKRINKQAKNGTPEQKQLFENQLGLLEQELNYASAQLKLSDAQLLQELQKKQDEYKKNLVQIAQRLEEKLKNETQLSTESRLYEQKMQITLKNDAYAAPVGTQAAGPVLITKQFSALKNKSSRAPMNMNPPTANLFIVEPRISSVDSPDADNRKLLVNSQKYAIRNSLSPLSQWLPIVDTTPGAVSQNVVPLFNTTFGSSDSWALSVAGGALLIDCYKKSIAGGPLSMSLTDKKSGLIAFDSTGKMGYVSIEPMCLSGGQSTAFGTLLIENKNNVINIYNANPGSVLNDDIYAYQFNLQKFWEKRDSFSKEFSSISQGLPVASVNFKVSFDIVTNDMDVIPYFAFGQLLSVNNGIKGTGAMPLLAAQDAVMDKIKQWLLDQGIVTIIPDLSADKSLAALINYPCQAATGN